MKIQIITERIRLEAHEGITLSSFDAPKSLDMFDINVVDLSSEKLWRNVGDDISCINRQNDFESIYTMIINSCQSKILFVLPQNESFYYMSNGSGKYLKRVLIKDCIGEIYRNIIRAILPKWIPISQIIFEPTETSVKSNVCSADFYFVTACSGFTDYSILTKSNYSNKATTIQALQTLIPNDRIYLTTLNIVTSTDMLLCFLHSILDDKMKCDIPEWMSTVRFYDDKEQGTIIENSLDIIRNEQEKIESAKQKLEQNARYKSILYSNGDELVEVVFEILEKILDCDLSGFVDEKKEDFLIKKPFCTFIGEIKGITSNIKNTNITQVELHYQEYTDKLAESEQVERVCPILIVNPSRNKEPQQREPVGEQQIELAKRNNCLIIETITLLHIFEKFLSGDISSDRCIEVFSTCTGLLNESQFDNCTPKELEKQ